MQAVHKRQITNSLLPNSLSFLDKRLVIMVLEQVILSLNIIPTMPSI